MKVLVSNHRGECSRAVLGGLGTYFVLVSLAGFASRGVAQAPLPLSKDSSRLLELRPSATPRPIIYQPPSAIVQTTVAKPVASPDLVASLGKPSGDNERDEP